MRSSTARSSCATPFAARQFVNHGHVKVNGRRVNIPSYLVKPGDVIEVKDKSKQLEVVVVASQLAERDVPDYIEVDHSKMTARVTRMPTLVGSAVSGADGTEPRDRVLFALTATLAHRAKAAPSGGLFSSRVAAVTPASCPSRR